jgi:outer membrane protein
MAAGSTGFATSAGPWDMAPCFVFRASVFQRMGLSVGLAKILYTTRSVVVFAGLSVNLFAGDAAALTLVGAIETALRHNTDLLVARSQVTNRRGALQSAEGVFDPSLSLALSDSRVNDFDLRDEIGVSISGYSGTTTITDQYAGALSKPLRFGGDISVSVDMTRTDPLIGNVGGYQGNLGVTLNVNLLRGSGTDVNTGAIRRAEKELEATRYDLVRAASATVRDVALAYWRYLTASRSLSIRREAEERARQQLDEMKELVARDERPSADLEQLYASAASRTLDRVAAEQNLLEARQRLGLLLGIPFEELAALDEPVDDFPPSIDGRLQPVVELITMAGQNRRDLRAARMRVEGARIFLNTERDALKPRLDLSLGVSYKGLDVPGSGSSWVDSYGKRNEGLDTGVSLTYEWTFDQNDAKGRVSSASAVHQQGLYRLQLLTRSIDSEIDLAWNALQRAASQLEQGRSAMERLRTALNNERKKLRLGMATVLDTVVVEAQYTDAQLRYVSLYEIYADALVELRHRAGLLVQGDTSSYRVDYASITTAPTVR